MNEVWSVDWQSMLVPQHSLLDLFLRGTIMYLVIFVLLRLVLRRQVGDIGTSDVLVIVLLAEVSGNAMAAKAESVSEGAILVGTVLLWSYAIEWAQFRFPAVERLIREPKLKLIDNGRFLPRNMRREFVTRGELRAQLREEGIEDAAEVKAAYLEADGHISIIRHDKG
ncbi:MAG: DUF421 domain-containing protein [Reyranella sp.]|uniref:DUF421 domain-containing protein n=1 Tax=Reyranella sp. TaxID=1929291 RepID=UPI003D139CE5